MKLSSLQKATLSLVGVGLIGALLTVDHALAQTAAAALAAPPAPTPTA